MTNAEVILQAFRQERVHRLLLLPLTDDYRHWLTRPCQLPLPFPSLGIAPLYHHLDLLLADWHNYRRSLHPLCLRYSPYKR